MDVETAILEILKTGSPSRRWDDLWVLAGLRIQRPIPAAEMQAAISSLQARGTVRLRGGAVLVVVLANGEPPEQVESRSPDLSNDAGGLPSEAQLMPALDKWLRDRFLPGLGQNAEAIVRDTSRGGPRSGVWSRPDYAVAAVRRYLYSSLREVDLYGFELKRANAASVVGVHEALAHTRWVHFSYLVWHVPDAPAVSPDLEAIRGECARHGVGLVTFIDPDRVESWRTELGPEKHPTDPSSIECFIEERFEESQRSQLKAWLAAS